MTLTSETARELQKKGVKVRNKKRDDLWAFLASGGARRYQKKLDDLSKGKKLTKSEEQFMDRSERLFGYVKSKAPTESRVELTIPKPLADV